MIFKRHQKKLIKFMEAKAQKLKEHGCKIKYFNDNDREAILNWKNKDCKNIIEIIKSHINKAYFLRTTTCPFCIKYYTCKNCEYRKTHRMCSSIKSDHNRIIKKGYHIYFTNKFYKEIVEILK